MKNEVHLQLYRRCLREGETIIRDYLLVPIETLLGSTLHGFIIRVDETETLTVTFSPLEVINNCPYKISIESYSLPDGSICRSNMVSKKSYSIVVLNLAVFYHVVFEGSPIFGDVKHWITVFLL